MRHVLLILPALFSAFFMVPSQASAHESTPKPTTGIDDFRYRASGDVRPSEHRGRTLGSQTAVTDTFYVYGGPGSLEGKFETPGGAPDWQGWTGVDRTETPPYWQVDTFNAQNLNGHGAGNRAVWSGRSAEQAPGWATPPGYGNSWDERIEWRAAVPDESQSTEIRLRFYFNFDVEPGFDFFGVEWDSSGVWKLVDFFTGTNRDGSGSFLAPGAFFDHTWTLPPTSLVGAGQDEAHLRLRVVSDTGWSDEDGAFPSDGAAQVDDISVEFDGFPVSFTDFESGFGDWVPSPRDFVGDFSKLTVLYDKEISACTDNNSAQIFFVDDGTPPRNASGQSTGGAYSPEWAYGPGAAVVNYNGGLTFGETDLWNEVWSPEILWDDPSTTADDDVTGGAELRFDVYEHLPLWPYWPTKEYATVYLWAVRFHDGTNWTTWQSDESFYFWPFEPVHRRRHLDLSPYLIEDPHSVQIALAVREFTGLWGNTGTSATPAPYFDNVTLCKYTPAGPSLTIGGFGTLFHDSFPQSGSIDPVTQLDQLSVRMDAQQYIPNTSVPRDSIVATALPLAPGTALLSNPTLHFRLFGNPAFSGVREVPAGITVVGVDGEGFTIYEGVVTGEDTGISDEYSFDIPGDGSGRASAPFPDPDEEKFFWPGDVLQYFLRAEDTAANVTVVPPDTSGWSHKRTYNLEFTIRALPSFRSDNSHPPILMIASRSLLQDATGALLGLQQNGFVEGVDYDVYAVANGVSSIGSGGFHGAVATQLTGYEVILHLINFLDAKDEDVLSQWHEQAADRRIAYFGDDVASQASTSYGTLVMGVDVVSNDVQSVIDDQAAPLVAPVPASPLSSFFTTRVSAFAHCPYVDIRNFDHIEPYTGGAVATHEFLDRSGSGGAYSAAAGVWHAREQDVGGTLYSRVDFTMPFLFEAMLDERNKAPAGASARSRLLGEVLTAFGQDLSGRTPTPSDSPTLQFVVHQNNPNPFNPSTVIRFEAPYRDVVTLRVYNLRGELVRTLLDGLVEPGPSRVFWDGLDELGSEVASGVYLYQIQGFGHSVTHKMVLLR